MLNPRFVASGTGSSAMMDGELKKTSVRANRLEKKRFEMMLSAFDSAKRNVANEIKKSQVDVKRRLKKYKDRQREILVTKSEPVPTNPDEHMLQQIRRLSQARGGPHHHHHHHHHHYHHHASLSFQTPAQDDLENVHQDLEGTDDHGPADSSTTITTSTSTTAASCSTLGSVTLPAPPDEDDIPSLSSYHHHHQQKSKADLRPYLAWTALHSSASPDPGSSSSSTTTTSTTSRSLTTMGSSVKLLQLRGGRLGTPSRQVRYLDEEEIERRCSFHRLLLSKYRHLENQRLEKINDLVGEFCGKSGGRGSLTAVSCPPIIVGEGVGVGVVSLPAGVPPSVHRAMRVKKFPLERWAKGNASVNHRSEFK